MLMQLRRIGIAVAIWVSFLVVCLVTSSVVGGLVWVSYSVTASSSFAFWFAIFLVLAPPVTFWFLWARPPNSIFD